MTSDRTYHFALQASAPSEARSLACAWAKGFDADAVLALELVVSELVTNAVQHGAGGVTMTLTPTPAGVRVGVHDEGIAMPTLRAAGERAPGGRGLMLVESLSEAWGVSPSEGEGKTVWAQIPNAMPQVPLVPAGAGWPSRSHSFRP